MRWVWLGILRNSYIKHFILFESIELVWEQRLCIGPVSELYSVCSLHILWAALGFCNKSPYCWHLWLPLCRTMSWFISWNLQHFARAMMECPPGYCDSCWWCKEAECVPDLWLSFLGRTCCWSIFLEDVSSQCGQNVRY